MVPFKFNDPKSLYKVKSNGEDSLAHCQIEPAANSGWGLADCVECARNEAHIDMALWVLCVYICM